MRKQWFVIVASILLLIFIGVIVKAKFFSKPGLGALQISTDPKAAVYLDGNQLGMAPLFNDKIIPGEHTVRLVPQESSSMISWEGKVNVASNILTVINRDLAASEASSAGEVLSLEKEGKKSASALAVVSIPDQAVVKVNGEPKGFAPIQVEDLPPGEYKVTVSSTGYRQRTISANTIAGYKLTISVKLAQEIGTVEEKKVEGESTNGEEGTSSPTPSPKISPKPAATGVLLERPYVKVKETPTGWLKVRFEPSTTASEAAKVNPGETYPYLNEEKNGWYKIEYEKGKEGWVSGVYADLVK